MLKLLRDRIHLKVIDNYTCNSKNNKDYTYDDAFFSVFLEFLEKIVYVGFVIFSTISVTLLFKKEILPLLQGS